MKTVGIALVWIGVLYFLKNTNYIDVIDWNVVWPVILIIVGSSLKHCKPWKHCGMGGKCGMSGCGKCGDDGHTCSGADCAQCKK